MTPKDQNHVTEVARILWRVSLPTSDITEAMAQRVADALHDALARAPIGTDAPRGYGRPSVAWLLGDEVMHFVAEHRTELTLELPQFVSVLHGAPGPGAARTRR